MAPPFVIRHPEHNRPVITPGFIASGKGPSGKISGLLIRLGQGGVLTDRIYAGRVFKQPPRWQIAFQVEAAGAYLLIVRIGLETESVNFRVRFQFQGSFTIGHPTNGATVEAPEVAGYCWRAEQQTALEGEMLCSNGHRFAADVGNMDNLVAMTYTIPNSEPNSHNPFSCEVCEVGNSANCLTETGITVTGLAPGHSDAERRQVAKKRKATLHR